jgi:hypothetical protein
LYNAGDLNESDNDIYGKGKGIYASFGNEILEEYLIP